MNETNPKEPADVMPRCVAWLKALPGKPVFVGCPASYDFLFVYWYLIRNILAARNAVARAREASRV